MFRLQSWAHQCDLVGGGGPQHPGVRREGWKGHRVMGHPQTTLRISLVSPVTFLPVVCLTVFDFPKPSGKPSQSRRLILAEEGLKDDQIHAKHIDLPGEPQNAYIRPRGPLWGLLRPSSLRLHSFPALLSPWASRASP